MIHSWPNLNVLFCFQIFVTFDLLWYCSNVCLEICNATGWYLFKINQTATNASNNATTSTNSNSTQRKNNRWKRNLYLYITEEKRKPDANRELELVNWSCSHRVISQKTVKKLPLLILVFVLLLKSYSEWSKNNQKKFEILVKNDIYVGRLSFLLTLFREWQYLD